MKKKEKKKLDDLSNRKELLKGYLVIIWIIVFCMFITTQGLILRTMKGNEDLTIIAIYEEGEEYNGWIGRYERVIDHYEINQKPGHYIFSVIAYFVVGNILAILPILIFLRITTQDYYDIW